MINKKRKIITLLLPATCVLMIVIALMHNEFPSYLASNRSYIRIYNISESLLQDKRGCITTQTKPSFIICTYDKNLDKFISNSLQSSGLWEPKMTKLFQEVLKQTGKVTVIDIGANIGYFSLLSAALGHYAIAIEPVERNVQKLAQATGLNNFQGKIVSLRNALSSERRQVRLSLPRDGNQGAAKVLTDEELLYNKNYITSSSIVLDDLHGLIHTRDVVIKIDIEGHECRILEKSDLIFSRFRVLYVITEWSKMTSVKHRYGVACPPERIKRMSMTLAGRGFVPYDLSHGSRLDPEIADRWKHDDVYWKYETKTG